MFYCNPCATKFGYPESMARSWGRCECCEQTAVCNDRPAWTLPMPKFVKAPEGKPNDMAHHVAVMVLALQAHDWLAYHREDPCHKCRQASLLHAKTGMDPETVMIFMCQQAQEAITHVRVSRDSVKWVLSVSDV